MFGVVRAYEGTTLFEHIMKNHETFRAWYNRMQDIISSNESDAKTKVQSKVDWLKPMVIGANATLSHGDQAIVHEPVNAPAAPTLDTSTKPDERIPLRILAGAFIALVAVFARAASSRP